MIEEKLELAETEEERRILEPLMQKESIVSMWKVARLDVCSFFLFRIKSPNPYVYRLKQQFEKLVNK